MASSLYSVQVVRNVPLCELPPSRLLDDDIIVLAKRSKWPKHAGLAKDPRGLFATIVSALQQLPAADAKRSLAANAKLLPLQRALKELALHQAGRGEPPDGALVEMTVTAIHPDAGMPAGATSVGKLDTFVVRLLASGSTSNPYSTYANSSGSIRVRVDDLWACSLGRPTRAKDPTHLTATLEVAAPAANIAHLQVGKVFESTAYEDPPKK